MLNVMLDLETMGTGSTAAVVAIGAVKFDPYGKIGETGDPDDREYTDFYMPVDLQSAIDLGSKVDGATVMWWLGQSDEARGRLKEGENIHRVLNEFTIWFGGKSLPTWGNGSAFDCVVLRNAYLATGVYPPWGFRDERCYRTLRVVLPEETYVPPVLAHDALEDAKAQATHLQKLFSKLNLGS